MHGQHDACCTKRCEIVFIAYIQAESVNRMTDRIGGPLAEELETAVRAARAGAVAVKSHYERMVAGVESELKEDGSPVTAADLASDEAIREILTARFPSDGILTEEGEDDQTRPAHERVWIADPLDGTKEFVRRTGRFDVLVALTERGRPIVAATCRPETGTVLCAVASEGAWYFTPADDTPQPFRYAPVAGPPRVVTSVWYGAPDNMPTHERIVERLGTDVPPVLETGFNPLLFADFPERDFDVFMGFTPTGYMAGGEWDVVVTDLIVHEAGGACTDLRGNLHKYNKSVTRLSGGLVVSADRAIHEKVLAAVAPELPEASSLPAE